MITLEQLLVIIPLPDSERLRLFEISEQVSLGGRMHIMDSCWKLLQTDFEAKWLEGGQRIMEEGKRNRRINVDKELEDLPGHIAADYIVTLSSVDPTVKKSQQVATEIFKDVYYHLIAIKE